MPPAKPYIPSVRARRLATLLREHREQAHLVQANAAASLGWSPAKVGHIENCRNKVTYEDVELMLGLYGVGSPEVEPILALAREVDRRNWWDDYIETLSGPYVALEDAAETILEWAPLAVPGLLQTQDYARAMLKAGPSTPEDLERRLRARMLRQTGLTRPDEPPHLHVVLDEGVLEREVGGPAVMRAQLARLADEARRENVDIQILPRSVGAHPGLDGSLIILQFADPADPDVGYVEGFHGAAFLESPGKVNECNVAFGRLRQLALTVDASVALIDAAAKR